MIIDITHHHCLRHVTLHVEYGAESQKNVHNRRVIRRLLVIKIRHEPEGGLGTNELEAVFDADRQSMERAGQVVSIP